MGTVVEPFVSESGFFAECIPAATPPVDEDFIVLTIPEAVRWYWLFESLTLTPSGSATAHYEAPGGTTEDSEATFSTAGNLPHIDSGADSYYLFGNLGYSEVGDPWPSFLRSPAMRVCRAADNGSTISGEPFIDAYKETLIGESSNAAIMRFRLLSAGGELRLYYAFEFTAGNTTSTRIRAELHITNPALAAEYFSEGFVEVATGVISIFGHEIPWTATIPEDQESAGHSWSYAASGINLTASGEDYYEIGT